MSFLKVISGGFDNEVINSLHPSIYRRPSEVIDIINKGRRSNGIDEKFPSKYFLVVCNGLDRGGLIDSRYVERAEGDPKCHPGLGLSEYRLSSEGGKRKHKVVEEKEGGLVDLMCPNIS